MCCWNFTGDLFMQLFLNKSESFSEFPAGYEEFKKSIIDGSAPQNLLNTFQNKVIHLSGDEAIRECLLDIDREKEQQKKKRLKIYSLAAGLALLILGSIFPILKARNNKTKTEGSSLAKLSPKVMAPMVPKPVVVPHLLPDQINFCGEIVPIEDKKISKKLRVAIYQTRFTRSESQRLKQRVNKWFPIITPILKKYQIPDDFKYIPLVETGFANSVSHKGAGGFWQLMEGTARQYGLKVTDSIDERTDVRRCTIAACKYIRDLHRQLGSWTLTAAAYNMGPGGLQNKVDDQNSNNYYRLHLNSETSIYVFKTLAYKQMLTPRKKKGDPSAG